MERNSQLPDALRRLGLHPPQEHGHLHRSILDGIEAEVLRRVVSDPERYTEETLAAIFHQLAHGGSLLETRLQEGGGASATKLEIIGRIARLRELADDEDAQRAEMEAIRADPKVLFDNWVWMIDPRRRGLKLIPFVLFDKQREIVDFIDRHRRDAESCMIEKTRDFGVSVIAIGIGVAYWLTIPQSISAYGSRKGSLVHKTGDFDSLIEKANIILRNLPTWMLPRKFNWDRHFNYMNVVNPANGAQIKGEAGDELGRGGRAMIFFADEFPKVQNQAASHQSLSGTTDCAVYFGTSGGVNTYFYRMKASQAYDLLSVPWYWDPRKLDSTEDVGNPKADSVWKRNKMRELLGNEAAFNQEFACDDSKALEHIVIAPEWVQAAVGLELEVGSRAVGGLDLAEDGGDETILAVRRGGVVEPMDAWAGLQLRELAPRVVALAHAKGLDHLYYDRSGLGSGFEGPLQEQAPRFSAMGINGQQPASKFTRYDDDPTKPARERFANKITELWWSLRRRFYRTWEHVHGRAVYPDDELISIPNDERLIMQLSARQYFVTGTGKIQLEPKRNMSISPDRADALAHAEEPALMMQEVRGQASHYEPTSKIYDW